ncbi:amidase family protein [Sedimentitalea nanhaiensis]|uniref:Amidase n=1 Tax=Sedimentitalea nanhaiensis TaxID=999627 RepID=A0A1I7D9Y7_9RHOB|nr:amidase family protein [Sedimentitalea nanhaiensis]SFU08533.1 amidase [Sedimentitalea nanhaiensis]
MAELWELTAAEIAAEVRCGQLSVVEITQAHLQRLEQVNPRINAVVQEFPDEALASARDLDQRIAKGETPGPLCGVPITIKVNVDQKGHATTNGLKQLAGLVADQDNPVVANLRRAGAIIVGRTNTPAFSLRWFTNNDLHGQTLNPRDAALTPGGSSGGAAAAVASGICAVGHGTDIAGSVRYPAYACGLHGLRPSLGRVPAHNATGADRFIGAQLMAVSGPITRSVEDIRLSLLAMAAPDPRDPWYTRSPLEQGNFERRAALCIAPEGLVVADQVAVALREAAERLRAAGWTVEETPTPPLRKAARINAQLWMAETQFSTVQMIRNEGEADSQFVYRQMALDAGNIDLDGLMQATRSRATLIREWETFLRRYPVVLCPVSAELPFPQQLDVRSEADFQRVFEAQLIQRALPALGLPGLTVAMQPVGVQLIAGRFREDILIAAGAAIEAAGPVVTVCDPE